MDYVAGRKWINVCHLEPASQLTAHLRSDNEEESEQESDLEDETESMRPCCTTIGSRFGESGPFEAVGELVGDESDERESEALSNGNAELEGAGLSPEAFEEAKYSLSADK